MPYSPLFAEIDALKTRLDAVRAGRDNAAIREALRVEFLYESNRIEGNTLTLRETQLVIREGMTISGKSMREHLEAINHQEAILWVEDIVNQQIPFSEMVLKQIHGLVLHGIDRDNAGRYRTVPVLIAGSSHVPPQPWQLQSLMEQYFAFYETQKTALHPVALAAAMHEKLVSIHPFVDGNGRTARLVMNLLLLQQGYPLAIIGGSYESRMAYYTALEQAATDPAVFVQFIAGQVKTAIERYLSVLGEQ